MRRRLTTRASIWLVLVSVYALSNSGFDVTEGKYDLTLAEHLLATGQLGFDADPAGGLSQPGRDGRFYLAHDIGNAVCLMPAAAIGAVAQAAAPSVFLNEKIRERASIFIASFFPAMYMATAGVGLFVLVAEVCGLGDATAIVLTMLAAFGTCMWPYSRSLFDGVLAAMFVTWAHVLLFRAVRSGSVALTAAAAVLFGAAVITRQALVILLPASLACVVWTGYRASGRGRALRQSLAFVLPLVPFAFWQAYYNWIRTGSALLPPTALPVFASNNALDGNVVWGLLGFAISPGKSVFLFSPVLVLAVAGLAGFWREQRAMCVTLVVSATAFFTLHAMLRNWSGDWGWGPRYTVTLTPLLCLPIAWTVRSLINVHESNRRAIVIALVATAAIGVQATALLINWHYRYAFAAQAGAWSRETSAWSARQGQFADALVTGWNNVERLLGGGPAPDVVAAADPLTVVVSNTANVWWVTITRVGLPRPFAAAAVALLLVPLTIAGRRLRDVVREARTLSHV
jgi:hypothetical protein